MGCRQDGQEVDFMSAGRSDDGCNYSPAFRRFSGKEANRVLPGAFLNIIIR